MDDLISILDEYAGIIPHELVYSTSSRKWSLVTVPSGARIDFDTLAEVEEYLID